MTLNNSLRDNVVQIFSNTLQKNYTLPSNKGNLYELYLFLLTFKILKRINSSTKIISPNNKFRFRCSPGIVKNENFSYIEFKKNGKTYELRNGIEVQGVNLYHEADIAIFRGKQLNNSRPPRANLSLCIECKNHSKIGSLKGEVRKFLGVVTDLAREEHDKAGCLHCGIGFHPFFATPVNAIASHPYSVFLKNYSINPFFSLKPNSLVEKKYEKYIKDIYILL
jgi:hypothetical protein